MAEQSNEPKSGSGDGKRWMAFLMFAFLFLLCTDTLSAQVGSFRTWTDASGKFRIEAKLSKREQGKVTLEKKDGSTVDVPEKKLSTEDLDYLNSLGSRETGPARGLLKMKAENAKVIELKPPGSWLYEPVSTAAPVQLEDHMIRLSRSTKGDVILNRDGTMAIVYLKSFDNPHLAACDLVNGTVISSGKLPRHFGYPYCVSPNNKALATYLDEINRSLINIWTFEEENIKRQVAWNVPNLDLHDTPILEFLDDKTLLASSEHHASLAIVDISAGTINSICQKTKGTNIAISTDRKTLVVHFEESLYVLDTDSSKVVGQISCPTRGLSQLALTKDGARLACVGKGIARIYDMKNGIQVCEFATQQFSDTYQVFWLNNRYLLSVGNNDLDCLDTELMTRVENFSTSKARVQVSGDGRVWLVAEREMPLPPDWPDPENPPVKNALSSFTFPSSEALANIRNTPVYDNSVIRPDEPISIELESNLPDDKQQLIMEDAKNILKINNRAYSEENENLTLKIKVVSSQGGSKLSHKLTIVNRDRNLGWSPFIPGRSERYRRMQAKRGEVQSGGPTFHYFEPFVIPEFVSQNYLKQDAFKTSRKVMIRGKLGYWNYGGGKLFHD